MKPITTLLLILALSAVIFSCKKPAVAPPSGPDSSVTGDWHIVNDLTITQFWGLWAGRPDTRSNYVGRATDHFNFMPDGTLYTSENNYLDTATYENIKNDTLQYKYWHPDWLNPVQYIVSNHTEHKMTLTSAYPAVSPETTYTHVINLEK